MSTYRFGLKKLPELGQMKVGLKSKFGLTPKVQFEEVTAIPAIPILYVLIGGVTGGNPDVADLKMFTSNDDGENWIEKNIETENPGLTPWFSIIVFKNGELHIFYNQYHPYMQHIYHLLSIDEGVFFDKHDIGAVNEWPQSMDAIVKDNGLIWLAYATGTTGPLYPIIFKMSNDKGSTWYDDGSYNNPDHPWFVLAHSHDMLTTLYRYLNDESVSTLLYGLPAPNKPPSLVELGSVGDPLAFYAWQMDYTGITDYTTDPVSLDASVLITFTGDDNNAYCYHSNNSGYSMLGPVLVKTNAAVISCGINRNNPNKMYICLQDNIDWETTYICTSEDGGATWSSESIGATYWGSAMMMAGDYFFLFFDKPGTPWTSEVYSNKWDGFKRIPQLDGEEFLIYNRAIAIKE